MIKKPGYTLLELLIAITIFSALIILSVAIFARTVSTAAKSNVSRQKTEAARSVIDQVSNDFRYVVSGAIPPNCAAVPAGITGGVWNGYCVSGSDHLYMILKYPGDSTYTAKAYYAAPDTSSNYMIFVTQEKRGCSTPTDPTCVVDLTSSIKILASSYQLDSPTASTPIFKGIADVMSGETIASGLITGGVITSKGSLSVNLNIKPAGSPGTPSPICDASPAGTCYQLSTTLVPGGLQ